MAAQYLKERTKCDEREGGGRQAEKGEDMPRGGEGRREKEEGEHERKQEQGGMEYKEKRLKIEIEKGLKKDYMLHETEGRQR